MTRPPYTGGQTSVAGTGSKADTPYTAHTLYIDTSCVNSPWMEGPPLLLKGFQTYITAAQIP